PSSGCVACADYSWSWISSATVLLAGTPAPDDELVAGLVGMAGAALGLAPGAHRVATTRGLPLTTTVRVVHRVHDHTTDRRALALPPHAAGLAPVDVRLFGVAHLAHGGAASHVDAADLAAGHTQGRVGTLLTEQLNARTGRSRQLGAAARPQFHGVDHGTCRDVAQRQVVTRFDIRARTRLHHVTLRKTLRRNDVALFAVQEMQQRDVGGPVGVVFDVRDLGVDAILVVATEVDHPVGTFVATTLVAGGDAAVRVTPTVTMQRAHQRLLRGGTSDLGEIGHACAATAGARRLVLTNCHV